MSSGEDPNPNPTTLADEFQSVGFEEREDDEETSAIIRNDDVSFVRQLEVEEEEEELLHGSAKGDGNQEEEGIPEEIKDQEGRPDGSGGGGGEAMGDGDGVWMRRTTNSEPEVDGSSSPSSSGYAGERGSSSATSGSRVGEISEDDEIQEISNDGGGLDGVLDSQSAWLPGKRHVDEDDASISWRKRKKHFFILSHSGKPIYSRYGDEHKLAGFSATLQAIISFVENGGDRVKLVRAGKHQATLSLSSQPVANYWKLCLSPNG